MDKLKAYDIEIFKLQPGQHEFDFKVDNTFFEAFEYGLLDRGYLDVVVNLDKELSFITLNLDIKGNVELTCDRSLEKFDYHIATNENIVLKFGDQQLEVAEDLEILPPDTLRINVAKYIYELITVAIPLKKLHPRFDQGEEDTEDLIYSTSDDESIKEEEHIDPRWAKLKDLKNN